MSTHARTHLEMNRMTLSRISMATVAFSLDVETMMTMSDMTKHPVEGATYSLTRCNVTDWPACPIGTCRAWVVDPCPIDTCQSNTPSRPCPIDTCQWGTPVNRARYTGHVTPGTHFGSWIRKPGATKWSDRETRRHGVRVPRLGQRSGWSDCSFLPHPHPRHLMPHFNSHTFTS